jgi:hypothetical protein
MTYHVASQGLVIDVVCEACGHTYSYQETVSVKNVSSAAAREQLKEALVPSNFGFRRCPSCKYLQSWMVENFRRSASFRTGCPLGCLWGVVATALLAGLAMLVKLPDTPVVIAFFVLMAPGALLGFFVRRLLPVNRAFAKTGKPTPQPLSPSFSLGYRDGLPKAEGGNWSMW